MKKVYSLLLAVLLCVTANAAPVNFSLTVDDPASVAVTIDYEPVSLSAGTNQFSADAWTSVNIKAINDNFLKSVQDATAGEELYLTSLTECSFFAKSDYEGHNIKINTVDANQMRTASVVVNIDNPSKVRITRMGTDTDVTNLQSGANTVRYVPGTESKLRIASTAGGNVSLNSVSVNGMEIAPTGNVYFVSLPAAGPIDVLADFPDEECSVSFVCNEGGEGFLARVTADDVDLDLSQRTFAVAKGTVLKIYGDMDNYSLQFFNVGENAVSFYNPMTYCVKDDVSFVYGAIRYATFDIDLDLECADDVIVYAGLKNMGAKPITGLVDGLNHVAINESSSVICIDAAPGSYILHVFKDNEPIEPSLYYGYYVVDELTAGTSVVVKSAKIERDLTAVVYVDSDPAEVSGFELRNKGGDLIRCNAGYNLIEFYEGDCPFSLTIYGAAADYKVLLNGDVIEKNWKGVHSLAFEPDQVAKVYLKGAPATHRVTFNVECDPDLMNIMYDLLRVVDEFERPLTVHDGTTFRVIPTGDELLAVSVNGTPVAADANGEFTFVPLTDTATVTIKLATATPEGRVLVDEDFAGFSYGTEDEPFPSNIANMQTGVIPASFLHQPGWTGAAIYMAGGTCAILTGKFSDGQGGSYDDTGFLRTPMGDYSGDITVKFRARLTDAAAESDQLAVILNSTQGRLEAAVVDVTPTWAEYSINFTKGLFEGTLIEFTMRSQGVLIDDILVTSVATALVPPVALEATDFYDGGFTAHWQPVQDAETYTVNVFEKDIEGSTQFIDFEDINVTSSGKYLAENPNLPEGWTFNLSGGTAPEVSLTEGADGSTGLIFDATDDGFTTPDFEQPIIDFAFYARSLYGKPCFSRLEFSVKIDGEWLGLGNIDIERIAADGEVIQLSSKLPAGTKALHMRYFKNAANDGGKDIQVLVDNIRIMTDPADAVVTPVAEVTTDATFTRIEGLDPERDYAYTVSAASASLSSAPSAQMMVTGLEAPALLAHQDLADDSYTACWMPSPKADGYFVNNYKVYTSPVDQEVTVLHEDFNKITEGTLTAPVGLYNFNPRSLDEYTTMPGWLGTFNYLVNGMLGTRTYFTAKGAIQTPALDLSANDGVFTVDITIVADSDASSDKIVIQAGPEKFQYIPVEKVEEPFTTRLTFDNGDAQTALLIYTYYGNPFYIDDIRVSQDYKAGQQQFTLVSTHKVEGHDNCSVSVPNTVAADSDTDNMAYRVFAYRNFYGQTRYSDSYDVMHVDKSSGIHDIFNEAAATDAPAEYFDINGRRISAPVSGQIVIERRGNITIKRIAR